MLGWRFGAGKLVFAPSCWDRWIGALVSKPPIVFIIPAYPYLSKNLIVTFA